MTKERYETLALADLRTIAKNRGMKRISTLKKADLIDAMLKRDEEEAIILRNERMQRRQMQEAAQGTEKNNRQDTAGSSAADSASPADGNKSDAADTAGKSRGIDVENIGTGDERPELLSNRNESPVPGGTV